MVSVPVPLVTAVVAAMLVPVPNTVRSVSPSTDRMTVALSVRLVLSLKYALTV